MEIENIRIKKDIENKVNHCLNCKIKPCSNKGCPLNNDIPNVIQKIKLNNLEEAYEILNNTTVLSSICGRICPHKRQCEGSCIRAIKGDAVCIGELEAIVGDYAIKHNLELISNKEEKYKNVKVAVVGGGPAGLTCSAFLAKKGINVTLFEQKGYLGGLLVHGIPEFRLPKKIVDMTIKKILDLGVKPEYNMTLGKNLKLDYLQEKFDEIVITIGANKAQKMGIQGENLDGVYSANELLEFNNHPNYIGKTVIVNGSGNVAMDVARTIKKLGAKKVIIVYRRSRIQMPADEKEIELALKEGIDFLCQNNIVKIKGNEKVEKIELIKTEMVKKEGEERLVPINIENSNYEMSADYVVMAIGSKIDETITKAINIKLDDRNYIEVDNSYKTSLLKVYAGGDALGKCGTVAKAARQRKRYCRRNFEKILIFLKNNTTIKDNFLKLYFAKLCNKSERM